MTITKGYIGKEDLKQYDGTTPTFTRSTSTGGTATYSAIDTHGVDVLQVFGDGSTRTDVCINNAITNIGSNKAIILITPGSWTFGTNITIPINITLKPLHGVTMDGAVTLTINGILDAGPYPIFGSSINVVGTQDDACPEWWGENTTPGTTDMTTEIHEAIDFFGTRTGTIKLQNQVYLVENLILDAKVRIVGSGTGVADETETTYGSTLLVTGSGIGVKLTDNRAGLEYLNVWGKVGNSASGVQFYANSNYLKNVSILEMGSVGLVIGDTSVAVNANSWRLYDVICRDNTSHGCVIDCLDGGPGPNANAGATFGLNCQNNGGDGLRVDRAQLNNFYGLKCEGNTGHGVRVMDDAQANNFWAPHCESNGTNFEFEASSKNNMIIGAINYTPTDSGTNCIIGYAGGTNGIEYHLVDNVSYGGTTRRYTSLVPNFGFEGTTPGYWTYETDASANEKIWSALSSSGVYSLRAVNDAGDDFTYALYFSRSTQTVDYGYTEAKFCAKGGLGAGNSAAGDVTATTASTKLQVFDENGASLGYLQIYDG